MPRRTDPLNDVLRRLLALLDTMAWTQKSPGVYDCVNPTYQFTLDPARLLVAELDPRGVVLTSNTYLLEDSPRLMGRLYERVRAKSSNIKQVVDHLTKEEEKRHGHRQQGPGDPANALPQVARDATSGRDASACTDARGCDTA